MMKKTFCCVLAFALFLGLASFAFASNASSDPVSVYKKNIPDLTFTAEQKAKMISLKTQMLELKKQVIQQNVANGTITQEQGKMMEEKINQRLEALKSGQLDDGVHRNHSPGCKRSQ